jgi:two-component system CheB/CheR fusion protein
MEPNQASDFYVVGVGASAGGLDALEKFFMNATNESGLAIVIVQHLSPDYKSLMADLLGKRTEMPVKVAEDGMLVEPNHVYLIPPRQSLTIFHRKLYLTERETGQLYLPIDIFFQSLADDLEEKAIGIILSGTGSDGTRGIRAIKEKGGLVMVQDEQTAKFDGMPRSAIATSLVDYILPPEQMMREMLNYIQHPCLVSDPLVKRTMVQDDDSLGKLFALLRSSNGVDFTFYKQNTMVRRIERRMSIKQIEKLGDYLHYLYQSPSEVNTLYREFLIGVTRFFRDPEAFDYIKEQVIPAIFANKKRGDSIRLWVAGCSTGEEAYSYAILLTEYMETSGRHMDVKVFATDLDKNAIEIAGKGLYPESIAADISPEYLQNYFIKGGDSYIVARRIREMVIFAQQNIITDPPFSKVDLISCRNVLIYLQPVLQKRVISSFQFALNPDGFMVLGTSETVGDAEDYFQCRDNKLKIYQYKGGFRPSLADSRVSRIPGSAQPMLSHNTSAVREDWRTIDSIQRGLLEAFLSATAVVDESLNLIYTTGDMDAYLRVPSGGFFTANILKQAREGLSIPISTAIHKVLNEQQVVTYKNIHVGEGENARTIDLVVRPFFEQGTRQKLAIMQFTPVVKPSGEEDHALTYDLATSAQQRIQDLEHELQYTRESLQATVEELETSNEELQATNEELFAANEELQSTNEELHSVNEELITVNAEYHAKIQELTRLNEDINNLLSSSAVGTVFLDRELRIRLFTPTTQREFHLQDQDVGRPLRHVNHNFLDCDLIAEAKEVLRTLDTRELKIRSASGLWYRLRLTPYKTLQQQAGGVIITFVDITDFLEAEKALKTSEHKFRQLFENMTTGFALHEIIYNNEGRPVDYRFLEANTAFEKLTGLPIATLIGKTVKEVMPLTEQYWIDTYARVAMTGEAIVFHNYSTELKRYYEVAAFSPMKGQFAVIFSDITEHKKTEAELVASVEKYRALFDAFPNAITVADRSGKIVESNLEAERLLGIPKKDQSQRQIDGHEWKIIRPDGSPMPTNEYASVRALKEKRKIENVKMGILKPGGDISWISVTAVPLVDEGVLITYNETRVQRAGKTRAEKG